MRRGNVKNMGDIKDFNCTYDNSAGIRSEVTEGLGLTFPDAYTHCDTMVTLSKMLKEKDKAVICELPFCHTLEAEAMGGIINLGNEIAGPRAGGYVCTDVEEILNLPDMDFTKGRIQETLLACKKLREEGEHVVFEVAGPFTILNVLIDARYVFKGMRKKAGSDGKGLLETGRSDFEIYGTGERVRGRFDQLCRFFWRSEYSGTEDDGSCYGEFYIPILEESRAAC